ncbi:polysaccharide deacetylase family protein [Rossellomorea vietnamensis]|uniref:polysaccharide deacetylase family protein n=1 Tax=Rossellomorea vietnamensis TaxID=218284 RepID=UPI001E608017|nr:polysaccharide deacetylase family protein [Rossellomorea vietnamensis]MCC5803213.1 polysaccharide deacetylase family protein [Rossellomorea vietnamensis]
MKSKKVLFLAKVMNLIGVSKIGLFINRIMHGNSYIRAVNYHSTPKEFMDQFEKQLKYYSKNYSPVSMQDLEELLSGNWDKDKPGLIISFDDGLETNYKYAKPLLEKYNFPGWFFIPAGLVGKGNCKKEDLTGKTTEKYMSWDQVKNLQKNHIIGCHTLTHQRLKSDLDKKTLQKEIFSSKLLFEKKLKEEINVFCWVGGEKEAYSSEASDIIKESNYKFSFLTNHYPIKKGNNPLQLERTNVEANWPIYLIEFYTSCFMDNRYRKKREEVKKLLN